MCLYSPNLALCDLKVSLELLFRDADICARRENVFHEVLILYQVSLPLKVLPQVRHVVVVLHHGVIHASHTYLEYSHLSSITESQLQ